MKPNRIRSLSFSAFALAGALSLAGADVSPLKVGNVWKYQGQIKSTLFWGGPDYFFAKERLKVEVLSRETPSAGPTYTLRLTDSLSARAIVQYRGADTLRQRDTVITWTFTLLEKGDSLLSGNFKGLENWSTRIPQPAIAGFYYNAYFRLHSRPHGTVEDLPDADRKAWKNSISDAPIFGDRKVEGWYVDDVGMFWTRSKGGGGCDGWMERELRLASFNGKPISIGIEPSGSPDPLAKEARIACGIRRAAAFRGFVMQGGGRADLLGRIEAAVAWRN